MYADQHPNPAVSYSFNTGGNQQRHIQIVDTNALHAISEAATEETYKQDPLDSASNQHAQLLYGSSTVNHCNPSSQCIQVVPSVTNTLSLSSSGGFTSSQAMAPVATQNDMEMEPIDLEEVQKIQARMPAADPNAPVGSNKNPIRIIQQGNQYITTQDVSDEHLQQIIQVLTNQALLSNSGSRPSAIYNRLTNRRIIFRVTRAKRRHDESSTTVGSTPSSERNKASISLKGSKKSRVGRPPGRKRRKRGSDEEDPDFEPEMPEEEVLPFPLIRRTSASGRISKPPKHLVKDYKHLRLEDLTTKPESSDEDDHSDGGYSDYINDGLSDEGWSEDGANKNLRWPCPMCTKVFSSRAGVARHRSIAHGPNRGRPRGRWANPYMASVRRRAKLREALSEATDDDLIEFVAPRLSKLVSPWDHLLMRSEQGNPPLPEVPRVVLDYLSLVERARAFLCDQLESQPIKTSKKLKKVQHEQNCASINHNKDDVESSDKQPNEPGTESKNDATLNGCSESEIDTAAAVIVVCDGDGDGEKQKDTPTETKATIVENGVDSSKIEDKDTPRANEEVEDEVDDDDDDDDDDEDEANGAIIVKVESTEQSSALGLPCGNYIVREPLREEYLPRRFRSILAAQRAGALNINTTSNATLTSTMDASQNQTGTGQQQPKRAVVAMETAEDDEVDATLRSDVTSTEDSLHQFGEAGNLIQTGDNQTQSLITLGEELLLLPEGGLGCSVPDEWLTSGAFLTVLTENGQTSDLVMEAATGRLYHRPTGHLVSLADSQPQPQQQQQSASESGDFSVDGYQYDEVTVDHHQRHHQTSATSSASKHSNSTTKEKPKSGRSKAVDRTTKQEQNLNPEVTSEQEQLLAQLAENGEVIDLNTLFPGVTVTEVSPGVCLVTKPNGDRFNVEHGGEGITLETLQAILQMDS